MPDEVWAMLRNLRIVVTVLSATAGVLLIALWVRSYWRADECAVVVSSSSFVGIGSAHGTMTAYRGDNGPGYFNGRWDINSFAIVNRQDYLLHTDSPRYRGAFGFGITQEPAFVTLSAPHWFFVLVVGSLGALPWVRPLQRFSLRTLLIAMTVAAAVLGIIVASI